MTAARDRGGTARVTGRNVDNERVSTRGAGGDVSGFDLDPLRERALAGEVTAGELQFACREWMRRYWLRLCRDGGHFQDSEEAEDIAQEKLTDLTVKLGQFLEGPEKLAGYLATATRNRWFDEYRRRGRVGTPLPLDDPDVREAPDPHAGAGFEEVETSYSNEQARTAARRRLPLLGIEQCPFHLEGCPHRGVVLGVLNRLIDEPELDHRVLLSAVGREYGYTTRDHTMQANLLCCYEWWRYRIFAGTVLDGPGTATPDRLRGPIIDRLNVRDGRWRCRFCSPEGARLIVRTDAGFGKLLRKQKPDVLEYLEGGAS
jgi:DNA-directed RNA polymerase specialized sigma24 family protein